MNDTETTRPVSDADATVVPVFGAGQPGAATSLLHAATEAHSRASVTVVAQRTRGRW